MRRRLIFPRLSHGRRACCRLLLAVFLALGIITLSVVPGRAADGEAEDALPSLPSVSAPVVSTAAESAPARATGDIILLSVPDAGGLRLAVSPDNKLHTFIAGHDLPATPPIPQAGFTADASGYVNGGSATLQAEHILKNLFGTGLDIKIGAGTKFTASLTGLKLEKVGGNGGVSLMLPLKDSIGTKTEIDIAPLTLNRDGSLQISGNVIRTVKVNLPGGFSLSTQYLKVEYTHTPGAGDDEATITLGDSTHGGVDISAPIPGVLTQNPKPLTLHVDSATVNTDGQVSFTGAKLSQASVISPVPLGTQVASLRAFPAAKKGGAALRRRDFSPLEIPLMKPFDFVIRIENFNDVSLSMANNVPTELTIKCKVKLPASFTTTPGGSDRVVAENVILDAGVNGFVATVTNVPKAYFKGFGVQIQNAVLDLSETKNGVPSDKQSAGPVGGAAWEGVYLTQATLVLPDSLKVENDSTSANPPDLTLKNAWIDNNGFSGQVTLTGGKFAVENFAVALKQLDVDVQRSAIKKCDISGSVAIAALGGNAIDVEAAVADSGLASLHVKTGKIVLDDFGAEMTLENGTLQRVADKDDASKLVTVLALTGNWKFTDKAPSAVRGMTVQVKDLQVDSTGKFSLDSVWLELPENTNLDFDVVTLEAKKIGFGGIGDGKTPWVGFSGSVSVSGDLPVGGGADFDGLYIYKGGHIHVGRIGIDCDVKGIIHISGYIEQNEGTLTRSVNPDGTTNLNQAGDGYLKTDSDSQVDTAKLKLSDGTPLSILTGRVAIGLPILGGGGAGGAMEFLIARNCWFVMGSFSSQTPLIPIGQSGLSIYGFGGGVGYNIKPEFDGATGIPQRNYQIIPDVDAIEGTKPQASGVPLLLVASVRLGSTVAPPPIWGDITFIADIGSLTFTLQGDCYLGETLTPEVPAISDQKSRVLSASISYDVRNSTFLINGSARFDLPKKEMKNNENNSLVHMQAPFRFKIGKYDQNADKGFDQDANHRVFYAALGGPVDLGQETNKNGIKAHRDVVINNPVTVKIRGLNPFTGAVAVDMNRGQFRAALKAHQTFTEDSNGVQSIDVGIGTLEYQYNISGQLDVLGWLDLDFPGSNKEMNMDSLSASGEFYLYAELNGTATNLKLDTFLHDFGLGSLGVKALIEADVSGSLTPRTFDIRGQVRADLDFYLKNPVKDIDISLPISKDIEWSASL